jgi:DNA-binding MarR family transcriptional regulator
MLCQVKAPTRANTGFLLAKASQRWNELLYERFRAAGYSEVRPAYGSLLLPLWEEDGLRMGELGRRARVSKQTMTTLVRLMEREGLVQREPDREDRRAARIWLTGRSKEFRKVAREVLDDMEALLVAALGDDRPTLDDTLRKVMEL